MDALTFIAKLVEFLAWPSATVVLLLLLRGEINDLFRYVKKLKAGPVEAEFEREVKELKAAAEAQPQLLPPPEGATPEKQMLLQLVQINPRSAVLEAWRGVEEASLRVIQNKGSRSEKRIHRLLSFVPSTKRTSLAARKLPYTTTFALSGTKRPTRKTSRPQLTRRSATSSWPVDCAAR